MMSTVQYLHKLLVKEIASAKSNEKRQEMLIELGPDAKISSSSTALCKNTWSIEISVPVKDHNRVRNLGILLPG